MDTLLKDVKHAIRGFLQRPGFTSMVVVTLALGLGANTAIFSFVHGILLRPLPFSEPDRLIVLTERNPEKKTAPVVSPRNLEDWQQQAKTIEQFGAWRDWSFRLTTSEGTTEVESAICSPELFRLLRIEPTTGRLFAPEENQRGHDHVVMISNRYWKSHFGADDKIIGQTMILDKESFTVIGVLPQQLEALNLGSWDVWAPLTVDPDQFLDRNHRNRRVYARLQPGTTLEAAQAEMTIIASRLAQHYPKENAGWTVSLTRLQDDEIRDLRKPLLLFFFTVGLVLLIACTNVANLLLARAAARRKEFALRAAIGATRFQLLRQVLTESVLLSLIGGAAGLFLAVWLIDLLIAINPTTLARSDQIKINGTVLWFTFLLSILTGMLFGLAPAIQSSRISLVNDLKETPSAFRSGGPMRLRAVLVISQIALALILLVSAGLLGRTFLRLVTLKPGYDPQNLLAVRMSVPEEYKGKEISAAYGQITNEIKAIPGVVSVGASTAGPEFGAIESIDILPEGTAVPASGVYPQARYYNAGPDYFRTMGIAFRGGRDFTDKDDSAAPQVAIVNESLARQFWPTGSAIGEHLRLVRDKTLLEIVGVVGDVKHLEIGEVTQSEIFFPYSQRPRGFTFFVVRTNIDPANLITPIRSRLSSLDPELFMSSAVPMSQRIGRSLRRPRFNLILIGAFAGTALLLASIGVYGVMSFTVTQQTKEIGIRSALGAKRGDVLILILGRGLVLALIGVGVGAIASLALTRFLSGLLFGVTSADPITFIGVSALLLLVVTAACYLPARRATKIDPLVALHTE